MGKLIPVGVVLLAALGAVGAYLSLDDESGAPPGREPDAAGLPTELVQSLTSGDFPVPSAAWEFRFPEDHGAHDRYRMDRWHLTGVLRDDRDRALGMQLLFMRFALSPEPATRSSGWAANAVYAAIYSISAPSGDGLHVEQRLSRGALGLAGAAADRLDVWVEGWRLATDGTGAEPWQLRLGPDHAGLSLELDLTAGGPAVTSGMLPSQPGAQSPPLQLYLKPRLTAEGRLRSGERVLDVTGLLSLDHAWGELPLPGGPVAQDRFNLYLEDGRDVLCIRSHRVDGSGEPGVSCLLHEPDQTPRLAAGDEVALAPLETWKSARTGARYPVRWRLRIPGEGIDFTLSPHARAQEGVAWLPFWAGPAAVLPHGAGGAAVGQGFVLLNGYGSVQ